MCSLLHFLQVSFLHPWLLQDSIAAVQANVSQRPNTDFYTSGKRVWNTTKWTDKFLYALRKAAKDSASCLHHVPHAHFCTHGICKLLWFGSLQWISVCIEGNPLVGTLRPHCPDRKALWGWSELCQLLRLMRETDSRPLCLVPLSFWDTWLSLGLLLHVHVAALVEGFTSVCYIGSAALSC